MATINTDTYLDSASRTAGEAWTINSGATFTVRTDTRWHAYSPSGMTGSLGNQTINEGKILYDGRNVRWLPISNGSGTATIGETVSQGSVSGYFLGFWSSLTSAPSTTIGSTGYIKLREVTGGTFSSGTLTFSGGNASATATGADVTGWIEVVADASSTITVPRLGKHEIRGDWFYLDNTDGTVGQVIQTPTNGGGSGTYCPGVWIETGVGTNKYEYWPALNGSANGWARQHLGAAYGETDKRQNFVKDIGNGQIQIGEASNLSATYASVAAQASTYASVSHSCTYTWENDVVTIYYASGHLLKTGQQVGLDFTSGGATPYDGIYTVTVIDAFTYTVPLAGSGTGGNVTARPGVTITFASHGLGVGDTVYCDFTSGSGVDGNYEIYAVTGTGTYLIKYPHTSALTSGNVSVYSRYTITCTSHGLAVGNRVYLDFTSGSGVDGIYTIVEVPDANTFRIVANNGAAGDSGNVTIKQTIGNIPPAGCKIRIPNVILRECPTTARNTNQVNATIANRPEWATTNAGTIDLENAYTTWYMNFSQSYSMRLKNCSTYDTLVITECATAVDVDNANVSMYGGLDTYTFNFQSNFAGGTVKNCKFQRGNTPGSSDHAIYILACIGTVFEKVVGGIIQYPRSTGYPITASTCSNLTFNDCVAINGYFYIGTCSNSVVNNLDYSDRYIGYANATSSMYALYVGGGNSKVTASGVSFGFNGTVSNVHPNGGIVYITSSQNCSFRNFGTFDNPLPCGNWRQNLYSMGVPFYSGGNNNNIKFQRIYIDDNARGGGSSGNNADKNIIYESVRNGMYVMSAMAVFSQANASLNSTIKGCKSPANSTTGQASVYGTHFNDIFIGNTKGRYFLAFNEPTAETSPYFTVVSGTPKFNSAGGMIIGNVGDQVIWEDQYYRLGHTGFQNTTPTMSGGTASNYTVEYQIDKNDGNGWNGTWKTCTGSNLSSETIDPAAGFRLKLRFTTTTANTSAITYYRIDTTTTTDAQKNNLYPLDTYTLTLTGLKTGTKVAIVETGTENLLEILTESEGSVSYTYPDSLVGEGIDIAILAAGYLYQKITNYTLTDSDASVPISQNPDYGYDESSSATVTFDGEAKKIICDSGTTSISVIGIYSDWVDWALTGDNLKYKAAFSEVGGNSIDETAGTKIPVYAFLANNWRIAPDEANHTLTVTEGIILVDGGGDPFLDTEGNYTVRINYQQPVQAISFSPEGGSAPTAKEIWEYSTRTLTGNKKSFDDLNDVSVEEVQAGLLTEDNFLALK